MKSMLCLLSLGLVLGASSCAGGENGTAEGQGAEAAGAPDPVGAPGTGPDGAQPPPPPTPSTGTPPPGTAPPRDGPASAQPASANCPERSGEPMSGGPYDHRLHVATSTDGLDFRGDREVLLEHASAPDAVLGPDGEVWVYFMNGNPGQHGLFIARHDESGQLQAFDCVRIDGVVDRLAVDPDVLRMPDGSYRLFYNSLVTGRPGELNAIFRASSTDGINFVLEEQLVEGDGVLNPSAVQLQDGSWAMTYYSEGEVATLLATSPDGSTWTTVEDFPQGIPELAYLPETNELRLYNTERTGLVVWTSTDGGQAWSATQVTAPGMQDPSVLRLGPSDWAAYYRTEAPR